MQEDIKSASFIDIVDVFMHTRRPVFVFRMNNKKRSKLCYVCGDKVVPKFLNILDDDLANSWNLDERLRKSIDIRESSKCKTCGSSLRSSIHAKSICQIYSPNSKSLAEALKDPKFKQLKIAEINANGALHKIVINHPNIQYSEYLPEDKSVRHENLDELSYESNYFDLVLTSETLEHVPSWEQALKEIRRILKPGGKHIFTTPTLLNRKTRVRAERKKGKIEHYLPASYHGYNRGKPEDYIVFNEFGADLRKKIDKLGYVTYIYNRNVVHLSDPNFVFVSTKV